MIDYKARQSVIHCQSMGQDSHLNISCQNWWGQNKIVKLTKIQYSKKIGRGEGHRPKSLHWQLKHMISFPLLLSIEG